MSHGLATRTAPDARSGMRRPWPITTMAWSVLGACTPINYSLPAVGKAAWFAGIAAMILLPVLTQNMARPLYPGIWIFAGYASIASTLVATNRSTVSDNLFVGAQLFLVLCLGPFALTASALGDRKFAERFFVPFIAGQTLSSFVGFLQSAGYAIGPKAEMEWWGRFGGLAGHPNSFGFMGAVAVLVSLQLLSNGRWRVPLIAATCINFVGILMSGSYTAGMSLLSGLVVGALASKDRRRIFVIFLTGGGVLLALWILATSTGASKYVPSLDARYQQVTGQTGGIGTMDQRIQTWKQVLNGDVVDLVYGGGLSQAAADVWANNDFALKNTLAVHNMVLRAWFQGGIPLGLAYALIVVGILAAIVRTISKREMVAEASVLAAVLVYGLVSPLLEQRQFWLPLLVAWGSISAAAIRYRDRPRDSRAGSYSAVPIEGGFAGTHS